MGPRDRWPPGLALLAGTVLESLSPMALWWGPQLLEVPNDPWRAAWGDSRSLAPGRPASEDDPARWAVLGPPTQDVLGGGGPVCLDLWPGAGEAPHAGPCLCLCISAVQGAAGEITGVLVTCQESQRVRREAERLLERQEFLVRLNDALRGLADPDAIQREACRLVGEQLGVDRALYGEVELPLDEEFEVRVEHRRSDVPSLGGRHRFDAWGDDVVAALRGGQTLESADVQTLALTPAQQAAYQAACVRAYLAVPLVKEGRIAAYLSVNQRAPRAWTSEERRVVEETAERTWTAVERARAEAALRESEERYRTLFQSIDEGFCVVEVLFEGGRPVDYRFLEVNPAFERSTGLIGTVGRRMRELVPTTEEQWFRTFGEVAASGEPLRFQGRAQPFGRDYDMFAFRLGAPEQRRVAILFSDITSRLAAEAALREANQRKDEFLAMLGHELRNPLAAISNATEVTKRLAAGDERLQRAQRVLERQAAHMTRLIDGLLEVSRIARGKIQLERETLDARHVVATVLQDRRSQAEAQGLTVSVDLSPRPVWVSADTVRLTQVVDNLLGNAIKFTHPPGRIRVSLAEEAGAAVLRIADTGVGMRPESIERLFLPFQQEAQGIARSEGGLGLGLALARGLVELHAGTIEARSQGPGTGAELEVRLPLCPAPPVATDAGGSGAVVGRGILIVEDNRDAGESLRDLLELLGHQALLVESGAEALSVLGRQGADLVLCDLGLPGMSGYDLARVVRRDPALRTTPLVAVTGYGQPEDRQSSAEAGFDAHLTKPVDVEALNAVLDRLARSPDHRPPES